MSKKTHIHKYYRTTLTPERKRHGKISGAKIWRCALPGCTHYVFHKALMVNRQSICWVCGEPFILTNFALRNAKPHCKCGVQNDETVTAVLGVLARMDLPLESKRKEVSSPMPEVSKEVERINTKELARGIAESREAFNKLQSILEKAERDVRLDPL